MAYKLLAVDVDDTLLNSRHELSERNAQAIARARQEGVTVIIATGRGYLGSRRFMQALELQGPMINYGGAQVTSFPDGRVIYEKPLPREIVEQCVRIAREWDVYIQTYERDTIRYERESKWVASYERSVGYPLTRVENLLPIDYVCPKALFVDEPENVPGMISRLAGLLGPAVQVSGSKPMFVEVNDLEATKGMALKAIASLLGVRQSEVMAIGDNTIDISMIQYAGLGVCMENGSAHVKEIADTVAPSNDDDGVAYVIEKYILS